MPQYIVQWRYASSLNGVDYAWSKGDIVEIDKALALVINLDSPGVLVLQGGREQPLEHDRQLKAAPINRAKKGLKSS